MKYLIAGSVLFASVALMSAPSQAACVNCQIQTKAPSATAGKFDFRVVCIDDSSGDELSSNITAGSDEEALELMLKTKC